MKILIILIIIMAGGLAQASEAIDNPIEVGHVRWGRDFHVALQNSADSGKPVLVLFQEIPGCSGVRKFGREVLTHPDLVKAIETEFIPMLVYNNRNSGMDRKLLERYQEPSWNFQVIRFLDADGKDIIPRKDRIWTTRGVAQRMIAALEASNRTVPKYLQELATTKL